MNQRHLHTRRILAIDPVSRGFGYTILEGSRLVDWGVTHTRRAKNEGCLRRAAQLMAHYRPDILVLEDGQDRRCRRGPRVRHLLASLRTLAGTQRLRCERIPWRTVRTRLGDARVTKHDLAHRLAGEFPELAIRLPPVRKLWMSEDPRSSIFDAVALAVASAQSTGIHIEAPAVDPSLLFPLHVR